MKKITKNPRLLIFLSGIFIVVVLTIVGVWVGLNVKKDTVAVLGDKKVTRAEYEDAKVKCTGFADFTENEGLKSDCQNHSLDNLLQLKALEIEAEKKGITVSDPEVEEKYKERIKDSGYEDEEVVKAMLRDTYNSDPETVKRYLKVELLKEKLAPSLISKREVFGPYIRWDFEGGAQKDKNMALAVRAMEEKFSAFMKGSVTEESVLAELEKLRTEREIWKPEGFIGMQDYSDLNDASAKNTFSSEEDWAAISRLESTGELTDIVKSGGGYVVIYKLKNIVKGEYNSWDEFFEQKLKESRVYSLELKYARLKKTALNFSKNLKNKTTNLGVLVQVKKALAMDCNGGHFGQLEGRFYDGWHRTERLEGVVASARAGSIGTCPICTDGGRHERCSGSATTVNSQNDKITLGDALNDSLRFMSCYTRWDITITKKNSRGEDLYAPLVYGERSMRANGSYLRFDADLVRSGETFSGAYRAANTDNEGHLYMLPYSHSLSAGDITVSPSGSQPPGTTFNFTATAAHGTSNYSDWWDHVNHLKYRFVIDTDGNGSWDHLGPIEDAPRSSSGVRGTYSYKDNSPAGTNKTMKAKAIFCDLTCNTTTMNPTNSAIQSDGTDSSSGKNYRTLLVATQIKTVKIGDSPTGENDPKCDASPTSGEAPFTVLYVAKNMTRPFRWTFSDRDPSTPLTTSEPENRNPYKSAGDKTASVSDSAGHNNIPCDPVKVSVPGSGPSREVAP